MEQPLLPDAHPIEFVKVQHTVRVVVVHLEYVLGQMWRQIAALLVSDVLLDFAHVQKAIAVRVQLRATITSTHTHKKHAISIKG